MVDVLALNCSQGHSVSVITSALQLWGLSECDGPIEERGSPLLHLHNSAHHNEFRSAALLRP